MPETDYKPFHETIVDAIHHATQCQLGYLGALIRVTKIPKNHSAIIAEWKAQTAIHGYGDNFLGVLDSLLEQKVKSAGTDVPSEARNVTA
jgi:hypothetical protein